MPTIDKKEEKKLKDMDKRREQRESTQVAKPITAFTMRHKSGTLWEFVTLTIHDGKVIKEEVKECFDKQHAVESFQIDFVNKFIYGQ